MFGHLLAEEAADVEDVGVGVVGGVEGITEVYGAVLEVQESGYDGHTGTVRDLPEAPLPAARGFACALRSDGDSEWTPFGKFVHSSVDEAVVTVAAVDRNASQSPQDRPQRPAEEFFLNEYPTVDTKLPEVGGANQVVGHGGVRRGGKDAALNLRT